MRKFIPVYEPFITDKEEAYILEAVKSGWVSSIGKYIDEFEKKFAEYVGVKNAVTTSNGSAALHLSFVALDIKKGDEVIVPDMTFIATANAVTYTGATPIFADIDPETWCIDPKDIKRKISSKTKAVIPVHLYGHPADMDSIIEISQNNNLWIIEDAAEAHGAEYKGKKVGSLGDIGIFSFYGNKIITSGEGGMITTNNEEITERIRMFKNHGMDRHKKYWHPVIGYNYRMTNLQAALGLAQLERINELLKKKIQVFQWYKEFLREMKEITLNPQKDWAKNVFWMVCMILEENQGISKDELISLLRKKGIDTRPFFYPVSQMPSYNIDKVSPNAYNISRRGINLPSGATLSKGEVEYVCQQIRNILYPPVT